jgi:hypothetical protein
VIAGMTENQDIIPAKELDTARFWVKRELETKYLPALPDLVEEQLFMQGRTPWNFKYSDLKVVQLKAAKKISFNTFVLLKKEFHRFIERRCFNFNATSIYYPETHKLKVVDIQVVNCKRGR